MRSVYDKRDIPPCFDVTGLPIQRVELDEGNLEEAIIATGAIPLVLEGVRDVAGARPGMYRDGGVIDYHLDLPHGKIPDRTDFTNYEPAERVHIWRRCISACRALADEFLEVVEKDQLAARLEPLW